MPLRPRFGAKDLVYAVLTESSDVVGGTATYGAIKPLAGLGKIGVNPNGNAAVLFADDKAALVADTVGKYDVSLDLADIDHASLAEVLGHAYVNGIMTENAADQSPYIALGFKLTRMGAGGVTYYDYYWLFKGKLIKPDSQNETKKDSPNFQWYSLKGMFVALESNGNIRNRLRTDDTNVPAATITNFFSQVTLTPTANLNALSVAIAKSSTNITFTFTKTGGGSFNMNEATFVVGQSVLIDKGGALQSGTIVWSGQNSASVVATFTPGTAFGTATVIAALNPSVKDTSNVACGAKVVSLSFP